MHVPNIHVNIDTAGIICMEYTSMKLYLWAKLIDISTLTYQMLSVNASSCLFGCISQLMGLYQSKVHKQWQSQIVCSHRSPADTERLLQFSLCYSVKDLQLYSLMP